MRTINVFEFCELSAEAKRKALDEVRETVGSMRCDSDADEYRTALAEIENLSNDDYEFLEDGRRYCA